MTRTVGVTLLAAVVILSLASCSSGTSSTSRRPAAPRDDAQHAIARLLAASNVATPTVSDPSPHVAVVTRTDATPTAASLLGVLLVTAKRYSGQGRHLHVTLILPRKPRPQRNAIELSWNPTAAKAIEGPMPALPSRSLRLSLGRSMSTGIMIEPRDANLPAASRVTTEAIAEAAIGQGTLPRRLQDLTGLP